MSIGLLGIKRGIHQHICENGVVLPVTEIEVSSAVVAKIIKKEISGYNAIQLAYYFKKAKPTNISKPQLGHINALGISPTKYLKEFRIKESNIGNMPVGSKVSITDLIGHGSVSVQARTIGKGFAGNIKRNKFKRGPESHGSKHHRLQGSLGAGTTPSRVFPGKKMAGHLGATVCTIKNLKIVHINSETDRLLLKGSIPGKPGAIVNIKFE